MEPRHLGCYFATSTFFRQFCTLTASNRSPAKMICLTVFPPSLSCFRWPLTSANYRTKNLAVARDGCHSPGMTTNATEADSLAFVSELQALLANALNSIAGKFTEAEVSYLVWGASHVNKTVAGYAELRKQHMVHASKIMVRPVMEATAAVIAALKKPGFLFQKAHSEYQQDKNLIIEFRNVLEKTGQPTVSTQQQLSDAEKHWQQFEQNWVRIRPGDPKNFGKLLFPEVLHAADLNPWYAQYRLYCQFTHGALRAASGDLDEMTDPADNLAIAWLTLMILDQLQKHAPVAVPDLKPLWERAESLMRQTTWSQPQLH